MPVSPPLQTSILLMQLQYCQQTGNRKPRIFFTQNNLIHLSPTLNILSQKAQPLGRSSHCGPPKWSLVHHHMSAHICRLHNSWWQDLINSSSLRTLPRDLFCAFERFSWHSWQTACWHSPLFALKHMNTQYEFFFKWIALSCLNLMVLQSFPRSSSSVVWVWNWNERKTKDCQQKYLMCAQMHTLTLSKRKDYDIC